MKIDKKYITVILILACLNMGILIGSWNMKNDIDKAFLFNLIFVFLNFLTLFILFLFLSGNNFSVLIKKLKKKTIVPIENENKTTQKIHREYVDPKSVAERIFKNVLLKRSYKDFGEKLLNNIAHEFDGVQGIFYLFNKETKLFQPLSFYALFSEENIQSFASGEGISGQAANDEKITILSNLPEKYREVASGLGQNEPSCIYFIPFFADNNCIALVEISTFKEIPENRIAILNYLISLGGKKLQQFREKLNE